MSPTAPLPDGRYDAIVVDASTTTSGEVLLELTILDGEHKGAIVQVTGQRGDDDPLFLLGIPGTLVVDNGTPHVTLEP